MREDREKPTVSTYKKVRKKNGLVKERRVRCKTLAMPILALRM